MLDDLNFWTFNPFRMLRIRDATPEERISVAPRQSRQLTIVSRMAGTLHTFTVREPFHVPETDMGISSLLSSLTAPIGPREPAPQGRSRRKVAA